MKHRVVVTGMGVISPVGNTLEENWQNITAGNSGIGSIRRFDASDQLSKVSGEARDFKVENYLSVKEARKMDRFIQLGYAASMDAFNDSGIEVTEENTSRIGVYLSSGMGGIETIQNAYEKMLKQGVRRSSPFLVPATIINMISGHVSIALGISGPSLSMATACASGTHTIGEAARMIAWGDADIMIAGGSEAPIATLPVGGFANAKTLTSRDCHPEKASCPWDDERDGFIISEGAAVVVLEKLQHAQSRGANIYAEVAGYGMSSDCYHITSPSPDGRGAAMCMKNALNDAGLSFDQIDYINAHGTSTPIGDVVETLAIKHCFGEYAYSVPVSSTKSMTGHLLGAAGSIEAIYTILALRDQIAPPTINLHNPSADCDLDYVPHHARDVRIRHAMSNSFGFGGTNGTLIFRQF